MTLASTQDGSNCIISLYHKIYYSFITINYLSINYVHISTTTTYLLLINYLSTTNLLPINYHSSTYQLPTYLLRNTYLAPNFKRSCITRPIVLSVRKYLFLLLQTIFQQTRCYASRKYLIVTSHDVVALASFGFVYINQLSDHSNHIGIFQQCFGYFPSKS